MRRGGKDSPWSTSVQIKRAAPGRRRHRAPALVDELARITGKAKSNLSRTLRTMEGHGLVRLERGERGRIAPKVEHDRVELNLPLTISRKVGQAHSLSPCSERARHARR